MFFYSSVQVNPRILNWGSLHIVYIRNMYRLTKVKPSWLSCPASFPFPNVLLFVLSKSVCFCYTVYIKSVFEV
ncbi:hypothetical protein F6P71_07640 [Streptococcus suis]|nr:hypothetical protein [Streptococcus suis]